MVTVKEVVTTGPVSEQQWKGRTAQELGLRAMSHCYPPPPALDGGALTWGDPSWKILCCLGLFSYQSHFTRIFTPRGQLFGDDMGPCLNIAPSPLRPVLLSQCCHRVRTQSPSRLRWIAAPYPSLFCYPPASQLLSMHLPQHPGSSQALSPEAEEDLHTMPWLFLEISKALAGATHRVGGCRKGRHHLSSNSRLFPSLGDTE